MARKHAQLLTTIWDDDEFVELTPAAQRIYMFLLSQPDLSLAGVLVVRSKVWARKALGLTMADVEQALLEAESAGFIVWDDDTDEVWIRAFQRVNVGLSPKGLIGCARALGAVTSRPLRELIVGQVHPDLREDFIDCFEGMSYPELRDLIGDLEPWEPQPYPPSDTPWHTSSDGVSDGGYNTDTGDLILETGYTSPLATERYSPEFESFWAFCPRRVGKGDAERAWKRAARRVGADHLEAAMTEHAKAWAAAGTEMKFIPHPATWLNHARYDDPAPDVHATPRRTTDEVENYANGSRF